MNTHTQHNKVCNFYKEDNTSYDMTWKVGTVDSDKNLYRKNKTGGDHSRLLDTTISMGDHNVT